MELTCLLNFNFYISYVFFCRLLNILLWPEITRSRVVVTAEPNYKDINLNEERSKISRKHVYQETVRVLSLTTKFILFAFLYLCPNLDTLLYAI